MNNAELRKLFDQQASNYDKQWARMAPINAGLQFLLEPVFSRLAERASILCVGAGTGREILTLAEKHPHWQFTAVEPSRAMLDVCRDRVEAAGYSSRCRFHEGYVESLPSEPVHDAATCFLVSQFILQAQSRSAFFGQIAQRLKPGAILASSDLSADVHAEGYEALLQVWQAVMAMTDASPEALNRMKAAYAKDVAVLPPAKVAAMIKSGGFEQPVQFFQSGLICAWFARRLSCDIA